MNSTHTGPPRTTTAAGLSRRSALRGLGGVAAAGLAVAGLGQGRSQRLARGQTPAAGPPRGDTFVGRTTDPDTFVAIVLLADGSGDGSGEAVGYLCAGPDLSLWFTGHVAGGVIALTGPDPAATATPEPGLTLTEPAPTLTGQLGPDGIRGEAWLPNHTLSFLAIPAAGVAGFYVAEVDEAGNVKGTASTGAVLEARQVAVEGDAPFLIAGTITLTDGTAQEIALPAHSEGAAELRWIALADGDVRGTRRRRRRDSEGDGDDFVNKTIF